MYTFIPSSVNMKLRLLMLLICSVVLAGGCSSDEEEDDESISEEQEESVDVRPEVIFAVTDDEPIYNYVESQGVVKASRSMNVVPRISGYVEQSSLIEGRQVQQGDTLISFVDDELEYEVERARNDYKEALSDFELENRSRQNAEAITDTSQDALQNEELARIYSGLSQAEVDLKAAELEYSYATITAPFSGTLAVEDRVEPGSYISSGDELGTLINDGSVRVEFDVLESELGRISTGQSAELTAPDGSTVEGTVSAVSPRVDSESKTGKVTVESDNGSGALRTGMTADGRIQVEEMNGKVRIPRSAVLERDGGRTLVFKLDAETEEVEWVYVEPDAQNREWALIDHADIEPGDTLAVDQHFALSHLQKVTPKMELLQQEEGDEELSD